MTTSSEPDPPNPLDDPPPFHSKLTDHGERPSWSPDGSKIAFIGSNYGDVMEMDVATREVRNVTGDLGDHHSFLRVLYLCTGDYLLIGPAEFKDRRVSRFVESELWVLDKDLQRPPQPLGRRMFEGAAVSARELKIAYTVSGENDPSLGDPTVRECRVSELVRDADGWRITSERPFYRTAGIKAPEPQDFRDDDQEVIFAEYDRDAYNLRPVPAPKCVTKGVRLDNGEIRTYIDEAYVHNEPEGIFPDHEHICLESGCDRGWPFLPPPNLWKLKLDGSGRRARMTAMPLGWRAGNSNVSPDGRWLAFMVSRDGDEAGFGRGLGLLDLEEWGRSELGQRWETPSDRMAEVAAEVVAGLSRAPAGSGGRS